MISYQVLAAHPFLGRLSAAARRLVGERSEIRGYRRHDPVISKGDKVGGLYLVVSGRLRVFTLSLDGGQAPLYALERGESCLLATSALFTDMLYPAWVEVESREAKLFCIPRAAFRSLYQTEPEVRDFVVNVLSGRIFDLMMALEERSLQSVERRLKNHLLRLADARGGIEATHQQIALSLGTAREVVSRKLRQLGAAGAVETRRGSIRVLKPALLG